MSFPLEVLEAEVLKLPAAERAQLLDKVVASLDRDAAIDAAWEEELDRREASVGEGDWLDGEEVLRKLKAKYG